MMINKDELLRLLIRSNGYVSGSEIASIFAVSRNAVWKAVKQLSEAGIIIDSKPNMGYKLANSINVINKIVLEEKINDNFFDIEVFDSLPSSSTYLKEKHELFNNGKVVFARYQSAGKGRMNRSFYSPKDSGLYFSILVKPNINVNKSVYLTVLSAVSVYEAILELANIEVGIKWVNDLYKDGKKIVGILAEGGIDFSYNTLSYCVIGIGINVYKPVGGFGKDLENIAGFLFDDHKYNINDLACLVLKYFKKHYIELLNDDYSFCVKYKEKQILIDKEVESLNLVTKEKEVVKVIKVNDDCSLQVIDKEGIIKNLNSGEVRLIINK